MQTLVGTVDVLANTVGVTSYKLSSLLTVTRFEGMFLYDTRELCQFWIHPAAQLDARRGTASATRQNRHRRGACGGSWATCRAITVEECLQIRVLRPAEG